jgi:predicted TIM-barrel fold metal-dependent hydrolase
MTQHAIDVVCNLFTEEVVRSRPTWTREFLGDKIGQSEQTLKGVSVDEMLDEMDRAGIQLALLIAPVLGSGHPATWRLPYEKVVDVVEEHPDRFRGLAGIDPTEGMSGVRRLESAIRDYGFVGAQFYPHWFGLPPDDRRWYPFYAKCAELDVPIQLQVGHCLRYSADYPLESVGRPLTLDRVACDLPELKIVASHIGWPWVEEMISVSWKHPNVYVSSDAYAPKHWKPEFIQFINTWGQNKVLFGTDFPVIGIERAVSEIQELGLREQPLKKFMSENALSLYRLSEVVNVATV